MKLVPELVPNNTLSLTSLSSCTCGASSLPNAAVAIRHPLFGVGVVSGTQIPSLATVPGPHSGPVSPGGSSMHWPPTSICPGGHSGVDATTHSPVTSSRTVPGPHCGVSSNGTH